MTELKTFNQYTGGDENLKYWDNVKMTLVKDVYIWDEKEFRDWMYDEHDTDLADLINKADRDYGIKYNPTNRGFYLPKGSVLKSTYFEGDKSLDLEYYYNGELIDSVDTTDDMEVEVELEKRKVIVKITCEIEEEVMANSDDQAIQLVKESYEGSKINLYQDDIVKIEFEAE